MPIHVHFSSLIPQDVDIHSCHLLLDHIQFTLIRGPNILGSYAILFFTASNFTFTTRYIHSGVSFPLWLSCFILSGAVSLLFPSSILNTFECGRLIFWRHIFLPLHTVHGVFMARILEWLAIPTAGGPHFVRTLHFDVSWVALHDVAQSFTGLRKPRCHDKVVIMKGHPH